MTVDVDLIFKIAAIGILVAVLNMLLSRSGRDDQALMVSIAGLVVVLVVIVTTLITPVLLKLVMKDPSQA